MSIETTLFSVLSADVGVRAFFPGSPVNVRLYPLRIPDEVTVPFIAYRISDAQAFNKLGDVPGGERKEVEFLCVSDGYTEAREMAEAIKRALEADYGYMTGEEHEYFSDTQEYGVRLIWSIIG